jgi:hypothetical protein
MRKGRGSLPLVFILAMGAETSTATALEHTQTGDSLETGALRLLLEKGQAKADDYDPSLSGDRRLPGDKTVQYFPNFPNFPSFFNCFRGNWRNC